MTKNLDQTETLWTSHSSLPIYQPLSEDLQVDVAIVGGGITGLTCAYNLSKNGLSVAVIDDGAIAGGETSRTTAHLTNVLDDRYGHLEELFGKEGSKLAAESHRAAIDFIEKVSKENAISCHFQRLDAYLFNPPGVAIDNLEREYDAATRAGLNVEMVHRAPFESFNTKHCLKISNQAEFTPIEYIKGLCKLIQKQDGKIFTKTHVDKFEEEKSFCKLVTDQGYTVKAKNVIIATNSAVNNRFFPHLKQASYRTYAMAGAVPKNYIPLGLYYDTPDPYHYLRIIQRQDDDLLIVGGEDHRVGECKEPHKLFDEIEKWTRHRFPEFGQIEIKWSGQIIEPVDSLAFIGRSKENSNVYIATGDSGNGLTHGTIAGILLNDLILGRSNPWEKLYDPHRITLKALPDFCEENLNTMIQYSDWVTPGEAESVKELPRGSGAIVRDGIKKVAVYKDEEGNIHQFCATCPHLKAIVRWNEVEKTWDCPAHGSRYTCDGKVINGPSNCNLKS